MNSSVAFDLVTPPDVIEDDLDKLTFDFSLHSLLVLASLKRSPYQSGPLHFLHFHCALLFSFF